jgi:hypothetical protein
VRPTTPAPITRKKSIIPSKRRESAVFSEQSIVGKLAYAFFVEEILLGV